MVITLNRRTPAMRGPLGLILIGLVVLINAETHENEFHAFAVEDTTTEDDLDDALVKRGQPWPEELRKNLQEAVRRHNEILQYWEWKREMARLHPYFLMDKSQREKIERLQERLKAEKKIKAKEIAQKKDQLTSNGLAKLNYHNPMSTLPLHFPRLNGDV